MSKQEEADGQYPDSMTMLQCVWVITKMAVPLIVGMFLFILVQTVNVYFVGNLNEPALLAGIGLGNMIINVLCFAVIQGLNSALDTLVSQSFGAQKYTDCGTILNRGKIAASIFMIPIFFIFSKADTILIALDQDAEMANIARRYCCYMIPGIWAQGMFDATRKFMSAQFETLAPTYVQTATLVLHVFCCWLFVCKFEMREVGAAVATDITFLINMIALEVYCMCDSKLQRSYFGLPNRAAF